MAELTNDLKSYVEGLKTEFKAAISRGDKEHEGLVRSELDRLLGKAKPPETAAAPPTNKGETR